jgi:hypothetical protein
MTNHQGSLIRISDLNFLCSMVSVRRVKVGNINMSQDLQKKNYPLKRKKKQHGSRNKRKKETQERRNNKTEETTKKKKQKGRNKKKVETKRK